MKPVSNGTWTLRKGPFIGKILQLQGPGVLRFQTLSTCVERNLFATKKFGSFVFSFYGVPLYML